MMMLPAVSFDEGVLVGLLSTFPDDMESESSKSGKTQ